MISPLFEGMIQFENLGALIRLENSHSFHWFMNHTHRRNQPL